jgi:WD40 repeat protein
MQKGTVQQKIDALLDAFEYGQAGLELIKKALDNPLREVREVAYWLLTESTAETAKQALHNYLPYKRMRCLYTIKDLQLDPFVYSINSPAYFAISPDGRNLFCEWDFAYKCTGIQFWDLWTGQLSRSMNKCIHGIRLGAEGKTLVGYFQHFIIVENVQSKGGSIFPGDVDNNPAFAVGLGKKPLYAYEGYRSKGGKLFTIYVRNYQTEQLIHTWQWEGRYSFGSILSLFISPDDQFILSYSVESLDFFNETQNDYVLKLWDIETNDLAQTFDVPKDWGKLTIDAIAIDLEGRLLINGLREGKVSIWDLSTRQVRSSLPGILPTTMTPDGKVSVCCSEENGIIVWDIQNNQHICTLEGQPQPIQHLTLSSNREWIASYTSEQTIRIYGLPER